MSDSLNVAHDDRRPLASQKRAYRLWFEYLKVARSISKLEMKAALLVSQPFYRPWEMEKGEPFDRWWKTHSHLFEERLVVRVLKPGESPRETGSLIVEIPLNRSTTELTAEVRKLVQRASETREPINKKSRTSPSARYKLSMGSEPKLDALREMLSVYRDVHLRNPRLRGEKLLEAVHSYYLGRKNKRWSKVPTTLMFDSDGDKVRAMRNLRRYIQKAEAVILNVARGQFPGDY